MARYYIIAGEPSGDMHGANLMKSIQNHDPDANFRFWGGDRMAQIAGQPVKHIRDLAFMGFWEVLTHLKTILKNIKICKEDIRKYQPDTIVLIDYPGFNLRIAKFAKALNISVVYYISPQIWAWKQNRIRKIKKYVDKMLVILPFEKDFYKRFGMDVDFVGHPLLDEVIPIRESSDLQSFTDKNNLPDKPIVALLPGSRKQEVSRMLEGMVVMAGEFSEHQFVVAGVSSLGKAFYGDFLKRDNLSVVFDQTYALLANAKAALVASGTATLETALFGVPQTVCYRGNALSILIARRLVNVKYISLVNLIMDQPVLKELIQKDLNKKALKLELKQLLYDQEYSQSMKESYRMLETRLGGTGASGKAAAIITRLSRM